LGSIQSVDDFLVNRHLIDFL